MYHVSCFTCTICGCRLRGMHFYSMENQPYCETCYIVRRRRRIIDMLFVCIISFFSSRLHWKNALHVHELLLIE